jgi:hypothetical protein
MFAMSYYCKNAKGNKMGTDTRLISDEDPVLPDTLTTVATLFFEFASEMFSTPFSAVAFVQFISIVNALADGASLCDFSPHRVWADEETYSTPLIILICFGLGLAVLDGLFATLTCGAALGPQKPTTRSRGGLLPAPCLARTVIDISMPIASSIGAATPLVSVLMSLDRSASWWAYVLAALVGIAITYWQYRIMRQAYPLKRIYKAYSKMNEITWDDFHIGNIARSTTSIALRLVRYYAVLDLIMLTLARINDESATLSPEVKWPIQVLLNFLPTFVFSLGIALEDILKNKGQTHCSTMLFGKDFTSLQCSTADILMLASTILKVLTSGTFIYSLIAPKQAQLSQCVTIDSQVNADPTSAAIAFGGAALSFLAVIPRQSFMVTKVREAVNTRIGLRPRADHFAAIEDKAEGEEPTQVL